MRFFIPLALISNALADNCTLFCRQDGEKVCTAGTWTDGSGNCCAYFFVGNPANKNYCYHRSATAATCSNEGKPVKPADVPSLLRPWIPEPNPIFVAPFARSDKVDILWNREERGQYWRMIALTGTFGYQYLPSRR
jgi:hypothetical protein